MLNLLQFSSLPRTCGVSFWFNSTPPTISSVLSLLTDLNTLVGPLVSAAWVGELPSARGSPW